MIGFSEKLQKESFSSGLFEWREREFKKKNLIEKQRRKLSTVQNIFSLKGIELSTVFSISKQATSRNNTQEEAQFQAQGQETPSSRKTEHGWTQIQPSTI